MADMTVTHEELIERLAEQFQPILDQSPDGVYLWLDETHKVCNEKLARMFGRTVQEWIDTEPFLGSLVAEEDQELFSNFYRRQVAALAFPVTFRFRGRRKDGSTFAAETDMIPITYQGHAVAYHFVREIAG